MLKTDLNCQNVIWLVNRLITAVEKVTDAVLECQIGNFMSKISKSKNYVKKCQKFKMLCQCQNRKFYVITCQNVSKFQNFCQKMSN